mmetsp:Transcript_103451/g.321783  ORF Transcript_103451/g.321783 Transcript_103451/m.321783 type:complete len:256 (-) Transcript_103451:2-769(-)
MEGCHDGAFKLRALASVHGRGGESFPDDALADVGSDEQGDPRPHAISLLHQLIEKDNDDTCKEELEDDEDRVACAKLPEIAIHATHHVRNRLAHCNQHAEELLRTREERAVLLQALVYINDPASSKQLHDHARSNDRRNTQLHQGASVRCQDNTHPVERVRALRGHDAVERDLAADQENKERNRRPQNLLLEWDPPVRRLHLWEDTHHRLNEVQEPEVPAAHSRQRVLRLRAGFAESGLQARGQPCTAPSGGQVS